MRLFEDVTKEFNTDFENDYITNDTLKKRYNDIVKKHLESNEVTEEEKSKFNNFLQEVDTKIKDRHDFTLEMQEKLLRLQEDIVNGFRVFESSRGEIVIKFPGIIDDEEIELECSKLYNRLLQDGDMLTETEIIEKLEKRNLWSKEKEEELKQRLETWRDLNLKLTREQLKSKQKRNFKLINDIKKKTDEAEKEYDTIRLEKNKYINNSIEMRVDELRQRLKLYKCVRKVKIEDEVKKPGDLYWQSIDQLKSDSKVFIYELFEKAQYYWSGIDPSFLERPLS